MLLSESQYIRHGDVELPHCLWTFQLRDPHLPHRKNSRGRSQYSDCVQCVPGFLMMLTQNILIRPRSPLCFLTGSRASRTSCSCVSHLDDSTVRLLCQTMRSQNTPNILFGACAADALSLPVAYSRYLPRAADFTQTCALILLS